jgi:serine O-acetyltransferase
LARSPDADCLRRRGRRGSVTGRLLRVMTEGCFPGVGRHLCSRRTPRAEMRTLAGHAAALNWHAVRLYRVSRKLHGAGYGATASLVAAFNRVLTGVEIPPTADFGKGLTIMHGVGIVVHHATRAGRDCTLYQGVTLGSTSVGGLPPTLGDGVTVFPGAKVLGPITLGDGCQVGANAVVLADVPPRGVAVGVAARLL